MSSGNSDKRAQSVIDHHRMETCLEGDDKTVLRHLLADLIEWSGERKIDFVLQVEAACERPSQTVFTARQGSLH